MTQWVGSDMPLDGARADLYRYVTADAATDYVALMRLFSSSLLADLSASEAHGALARAGTSLPLEDVEARCRQLVEWGNLVTSLRDANVNTVREFMRSRARYQVSKLGGRVQAQVDEIAAAVDGAQNVARELLGQSVAILDRILSALDAAAAGTGVAPTGAGAAAPFTADLADAFAADVITIFQSHEAFTGSVRDFYAFLSQILTRYDLAGTEYSAFKELLMDYVDLLSADVARHAPAITERLDLLEPHLDRLLAVLDSQPGLIGPDGTKAARSLGWRRQDWDGLAEWYSGRRSERSGPEQLRNAAEQALGQLIANAKRMLAAAGTGVSRRADLLRLAAWFAQSDTADAHRLFNASFGTYPCRHLLRGPEEETGRANALTSWWDAAPVEVPMSLRERGDRIARGRPSRVPDPGLEREALLQDAALEAEARAAAAAELVAAGRLDGSRLTAAARDLLLDRLGDLIARDQMLATESSLEDVDLALTLTVVPSDTPTRITCDDGDLTIHHLQLRVAPTASAPPSLLWPSA